MAEQTESGALAVIREALIAEGAAPGASIHGWRCEHPDRFGPCACVDEVTHAVVKALAETGYAITREALCARSGGCRG